MDKDKLIPLILAGLLGAGGGTGAGSMLMSHEHPEIINEIRKVQYEGEIFKLEVTIESMESEGGKDTAAYNVAVAQLTKFTSMLTELGR